MPQIPDQTSFLSRHRTICAVLEEIREVAKLGLAVNPEDRHRIPERIGELVDEAKDYAQRMSNRLMEYKRAEEAKK
jgi:hypothetical protein